MKTLILSAIASVLAVSRIFAQVPLPPPGAPAPKMKTLDQVEPRIPLVVGASGVTPEVGYHFVISQSGSYYLTGNLSVTKANGIDVRAEGVTLDLLGYESGGFSALPEVASRAMPPLTARAIP